MQEGFKQVECSQCGNLNPADSRFCNECGGPTPKEPEREVGIEEKQGQILCQSCDSQNPAESKFCNECGSSLLVTPEKVGKICPSCGKISDYNMRLDRWWCANCDAFLTEEGRPEERHKEDVGSHYEPTAHYTPQPSKIEVKQSGSGGWIAVLIIVVVLIVIGLFLLQSGALSGAGGFGGFECSTGTIIATIPLLCIPLYLKRKEHKRTG